MIIAQQQQLIVFQCGHEQGCTVPNFSAAKWDWSTMWAQCEGLEQWNLLRACRVL